MYLKHKHVEINKLLMLFQKPCSDFRELEKIHRVGRGAFFYISFKTSSASSRARWPRLWLFTQSGQQFRLTAVSCILKEYTLRLYHLEHISLQFTDYDYDFLKRHYEPKWYLCEIFKFLLKVK